VATALEIVRVSKTYGGPPLFTDLSFTVTQGLVAVSGRNGSGKTTLLKILAGLGRPSSGTVRVLSEGRELAGDARRLAVGWTGPDLAFYEDFTAGENLAFPARGGARAGARADATLDGRSAGAALSKRVGEPTGGGLATGLACLFDPGIRL
jgi:ABC-type multidrug transport system ATPase subunit